MKRVFKLITLCMLLLLSLALSAGAFFTYLQTGLLDMRIVAFPAYTFILFLFSGMIHHYTKTIVGTDYQVLPLIMLFTSLSCFRVVPWYSWITHMEIPEITIAASYLYKVSTIAVPLFLISCLQNMNEISNGKITSKSFLIFAIAIFFAYCAPSTTSTALYRESAYISGLYTKLAIYVLDGIVVWGFISLLMTENVSRHAGFKALGYGLFAIAHCFTVTPWNPDSALVFIILTLISLTIQITIAKSSRTWS